MSARRGRPPFSLAGRLVPAAVEIRTVTLAAGAELPCAGPQFAGALVVVEAGEVELECALGSRASFTAGAVLCFDRLPGARLRNTSRHAAVLTALSRSQARAQPLLTRPPPRQSAVRAGGGRRERPRGRGA